MQRTARGSSDWFTASKMSRTKIQNLLEYLLFCSNFSLQVYTFSTFWACFIHHVRKNNWLGHIEQFFSHKLGGWKWCSHKEKMKLSHDDSSPGAWAFLYIKYNEIGNEIQREGRSEDENQTGYQRNIMNIPCTGLGKYYFSKSTRGWIFTRKEHFTFSSVQQGARDQLPKQCINITNEGAHPPDLQDYYPWAAGWVIQVERQELCFLTRPDGPWSTWFINVYNLELNK